MTPVNIFLVIFAITVVILVMAFLSSGISARRNAKKEKNDFKAGRRVCIHTIEDCENCSVAGNCVQKEGKGLLFRQAKKE